MVLRFGAALNAVFVSVAVCSPIATHLALSFGRGYGAAVALAGLQAVAVGGVVAGVVGRRWVGGVAGCGVTGVLLGALVLGGRGGAGLLAAAGVSHAMLYGALLAVFGATLRRGRESLVTGFARRLNPSFHAGMVPYTRAVTWAWCGFFALQLLASAVLLWVGPAWWGALVTTVHAPLVAAMAVGEFAVRRWRWRHDRPTGLMATVRGVGALARAARTSRPG